MNILITGAWKVSSSLLDTISSMGHKYLLLQNEQDPLPCSYDWVQAVVCNGLFLHHRIELFISLKYIQLTSAGFDRVPMTYVQEHGIQIYNARGVYNTPMAEFALSGVLQLYKQSRFFFKNQQHHLWDKHRGLLELAGKTVSIIGCGSVGLECARKFSAMDCHVLGIDAVCAERPYIKKVYPLSAMPEVLSRSDIVILCVPLLPETEHLIDKAVLEYMKQSSVLVNISRGAVVDTSALIFALRDKLLGAVLDVFEQEPLEENSALWDMENVILTPHNSFVGEGNASRLNHLIINNLENVE